MRLSKRAKYALQAILFLSEPGPNQPVPCKEIADRVRMPQRFLLQILGQLASYGILSSTRGVDGGYVLDRDINDITLYDVLEAIGESDLFPDDPPASSDRRIDPAHDATQEKMRHLHTELHRVLQQFKIARYFDDQDSETEAEPNGIGP